MNKKTIITILLALVAMTGKAQIHYQIDGNTGHPDFTGTLYLYDYSAIVDSIQVVNGVIILHNGTLPSVKKCALINKKTGKLLSNLCSSRTALYTSKALLQGNGTTRRARL